MRTRALISLILVVSITAVFSLGTLAASEALTTGTEKAVDPDGGNRAEPSVIGTCVAIGEVKIDGNLVASGATVTNGDTIAAGSDGDASIELGPMGRIQLRPNTTIKLTLATDTCRILIERCGSVTHTLAAGVVCQVKLERSTPVEVAVTSGEAKVRYRSAKVASDRILKAEDSASFDDIEDVTSTGEAIITINCCSDCHPVVAFPPALFGLFGAVGATTVIFGTPRRNEPPQASATIPQ